MLVHLCGLKHSFIIENYPRFELDLYHIPYNFYNITPLNVLLCKKHVKQYANASQDKLVKTSWHIPKGILVLYSGHIHCGYALWSLQWASNTQNNVFWMRKRLLAYDNAVLNYSQSLNFKSVLKSHILIEKKYILSLSTLRHPRYNLFKFKLKLTTVK